MAINETKKTARESIFLRLTIDGAFQRSKIYEKNVSDASRREFRKFIGELLHKTLTEIQRRERYTDNDHYSTIEKVSKVVTNKYSIMLNENRLRIGNAQKFVNLYWKVCWLLQPKISIPIHCPFDSIVIRHLGKDVQKIAWTKFQSLKDYIKLVEAGKVAAGAKNIAEWELEIYQKANRNL